MAEMFGVSDAEVAQRPNYMQRLQAQEIMGRIAMQPAELRGAEARAAEHEANAAEKMDVLRRNAVIRKLSEAAPARGHVATMEDVEDVLTERSPAKDMRDLYEKGRAAGMSPMDLADVATKWSTLASQEATAKNARSNQQLHEGAAVAQRAVREGSLAMSALESPQAYATLRMSTPELNRLPQSFEAAKPFLEHLVNTARSVQVQEDQRRKAERTAQLAEAAEADKARRTAVAEKAAADAKAARIKAEHLEKTGGAGDPDAVAAKRASTRQKNAAAEKLELQVRPKVPVPDARVLGEEYTWPDGRIVRWVIREDTGEPGFMVIKKGAK